MPPSRYLVSHPSDYPDIVLYRGTALRGQVEGHAHEALELEILKAGENRFRYRGQEHRQPPRSLLVIPAGARHEGGAAPGTREHLPQAPHRPRALRRSPRRAHRPPRRAHPEVGWPRLEDWLAQRTSVIVG